MDDLQIFVLGCEKIYDIMATVKTLSVDVCKALSLFHAFTGCDTTSSFFNVSKSTFFAAFKENEQIISSFLELAESPAESSLLSEIPTVETCFCNIFKNHISPELMMSGWTSSSTKSEPF